MFAVEVAVPGGGGAILSGGGGGRPAGGAALTCKREASALTALGCSAFSLRSRVWKLFKGTFFRNAHTWLLIS